MGVSIALCSRLGAPLQHQYHFISGAVMHSTGVGRQGLFTAFVSVPQAEAKGVFTLHMG